MDIVQAWVDGWVVSRGAAEPVEQPWGWTIDVGLRHQATRHVLPAADEPTVRKLTEEVGAPGVWLKLFEAPETVAPWLAPGWTVDAPAFLMTGRLRPATAPVPDGYRLRTWNRGGVSQVLVVTDDGGFAARGQIAPTGQTAVLDRIETDPTHRRRGLGRLVMRTLTNIAVVQGATTGVLGATVEGRCCTSHWGGGCTRR
ncbi:GNAT family N-acetyltransferase [Streptomyces himalayensis]|uniref:GNAT family N-acetyltransferase n=1 Tax=Streptomyces himalayensis TaxID=2820085 RepID=UPI002868147D|nr:GNAT family N-acetyltransferase [Streptomyces himalayensis]